MPCNEGIYNRGVDGIISHSPRCKATANIRKGSFFEESKLQLYQILGLTYVWAWSAGRSRGMPVKQCVHDLDIGGKETVTEWNQFCWDVVLYLRNHPQRLGSPGMILEIDESLFARRKCNRGHVIAEQWIVGGYDIQTKHGFLVTVLA